MIFPYIQHWAEVLGSDCLILDREHNDNTFIQVEIMDE